LDLRGVVLLAVIGLRVDLEKAREHLLLRLGGIGDAVVPRLHQSVEHREHLLRILG